MADPVVTQTGRIGRLTRIVLILSLALNLAILGLVAGSFLRADDGKRPGRFSLELGPVASALAPEDRRAILSALRDRRDLRPRRGRPEELDVILLVLRAETLDVAALDQALAAPLRRIADVQQVVTGALSERIQEMSADERAAFADRLEEAMTRTSRRGGTIRQR